VLALTPVPRLSVASAKRPPPYRDPDVVEVPLEVLQMLRELMMNTKAALDNGLGAEVSARFHDAYAFMEDNM